MKKYKNIYCVKIQSEKEYKNKLLQENESAYQFFKLRKELANVDKKGETIILLIMYFKNDVIEIIFNKDLKITIKKDFYYKTLEEDLLYKIKGYKAHSLNLDDVI